MVIGETPLSTPAVSSTETRQRRRGIRTDPFAIAATEPHDIELATDVRLGLVDDGTQSDVAPAPESTPLEGLRSYEPASSQSARDRRQSEMEPFYDILMARRHRLKEPDRAGSCCRTPPAIELEERPVTPAVSSPSVREPLRPSR
jgi:hypothetical protein